MLGSLGRGTLIALQKPRKPLGPLSSLRPIVLLSCTRKVISLVALHRMQKKVNTFTGATKGDFKHGRSCADLVWAQRMLIATVQCRQWDFQKMGIDMSHAFDTIKQRKALEVLDMAGCNDDDHWLVGLIVPCTLHLLPSCCIMCSAGKYIMAEPPSFRPRNAPRIRICRRHCLCQ